MTTTTIRKDDDYEATIESLGLPCDMAREIRGAFGRSDATMAIYSRVPSDPRTHVATHYLYFPACGRGAVCDNGDSQWTDCTSLEDLVDRWANYHERWSN